MDNSMPIDYQNHNMIKLRKVNYIFVRFITLLGMTDLYFREKNIRYPAENYFKVNMNKFLDVLTITRKYLDEKLEIESQPTEINYVRYPHLGEELFMDHRIASDIFKEPKEHFNNLGGLAIYIKDEKDQNQILKEGFRDLRIIYISIVEHYNIIENALGVIHELNHFKDPFSSSINYAIEFYEEGYWQDTRLFIQFNIRDILNEYHANLKAYKYLTRILFFLNLQEFNIKGILGQTLYNITNSLGELKDQLTSLKNLEENYQRFNLYLSGCFHFFEMIFKLIGKWHGLKKNYNDIDIIFFKILENIKQQLENNSFNFIIDYLDLIIPILNSNHDKSKTVEELYTIFNQLASRYPNIIKTFS